MDKNKIEKNNKIYTILGLLIFACIALSKVTSCIICDIMANSIMFIIAVMYMRQLKSEGKKLPIVTFIGMAMFGVIGILVEVFM